MKHTLRIEEVFHAFREDLDRVEQILLESLHSDVLLISQVGRYVFKSGGKRMRPLLTILSSRLCGYEGTAHYRIAAVMELIHTATLLHDDVVDHAEIRRGARSVNNLWSNETSILMGDFLFTRSFCMMVEHHDLRLLDLMAHTCRLLAEGELLELAKSGDPEVDEDDYLAIVQKKTAVLLSASCRAGAILAQCRRWEDELASFGMNLGMAFQLVDDLLDYEADEEELGKTIGKDLSEGKVTLPIIQTLKRCPFQERRRIQEVIRSRSTDPEDLQLIHHAIERHDGLVHTLRTAQGYVQRAKACLSRLPDGLPKSALLAVADFVASRRK